MKSRTLICITAISLFAALANPVQLAAQQTRYTLIDLGTLGGPNSATNGGPPSMINNGGGIAGMADTTAPCAYLGGVLSPAVKWEKGVPINLGLLPGGCSCWCWPSCYTAWEQLSMLLCSIRSMVSHQAV